VLRCCIVAEILEHVETELPVHLDAHDQLIPRGELVLPVEGRVHVQRIFESC
jgi:hypothetical protein